MKTSDIISLIETCAPTVYAASWDKSGIQVAGSEREINKIALGLDPLPETISKALESGAQFVLTHHPLTLDPRLPNKLDGFHDVLKMLLSSDVTLFSSHTSLDVQVEGPVSWLAHSLELENVRALEETSRTEDGRVLGFGCIGSFGQEVEFSDFARRITALVGIDVFSVCGPIPDKVRTVAMCPGSGSSMMDEAVLLGADVFITGDVKYHPAQEAGIAVMDVGHFSLEEEMMRRLSITLSGKLEGQGVEVEFFKGRDPFNYYVDGEKH